MSDPDTVTYARYVALGDSQTEGLNDGDGRGGYRGWADRLAEHLAVVEPRVRYANLAVRGQLAEDVRSGQLAAAVALRPDLASVMAGVNDLLRPRYDASEVAAHLEEMFAALAACGAHVVTVTFPNVVGLVPGGGLLARRVLDFNTRIRAAAARYAVTVVELATHSVTTDLRLWSPDRLHLNACGHALLADAVADALSLPGSNAAWAEPLPAEQTPNRWQRARTDLRWASTFVGPWLVRRMLGRSSGDGRTAKRPELHLVRAKT